jgi:D-sedoheptulose 7-phosphate isomerase
MKNINYFIKCGKKILDNIDKKDIEDLINLIFKVKKNKGRIFFLGVGGSASNASHAVNDFRKIAEIECYTPTDNVSEFSARINDDGWENSFSNWLKVSHLNKNDLVFILSVGGGNLKKNISTNLISAIKLAKNKKASVAGIVGRDGGYTLKNSNSCVLVPTVDDSLITPMAEAMQAFIWHLIISHPKIKKKQTKWESYKTLAKK